MIIFSARSTVTAQGQVLILPDVRQKLGIGPGSILEWAEEEGKIMVRRMAQFTSEDIHRAVFPEGVPKSRTVEEMKERIRSMSGSGRCAIDPVKGLRRFGALPMLVSDN